MCVPAITSNKQNKALSVIHSLNTGVSQVPIIKL